MVYKHCTLLSLLSCYVSYSWMHTITRQCNTLWSTLLFTLSIPMLYYCSCSRLANTWFIIIVVIALHLLWESGLFHHRERVQTWTFSNLASLGCSYCNTGVSFVLNNSKWFSERSQFQGTNNYYCCWVTYLNEKRSFA